MVTRFSRLLRAWSWLGPVVLIAACVDQRPPTDPQVPIERTRDQIWDGGHSSGNPHFYFLPPLVKAPTFGGLFDDASSPVVEICEWNGARCVEPLVARFTTTGGGGSETVRVDPADELYIVNWHTDQFDLDVTKTYRIRVLLSFTEVGHADVDVVRTGGEVKNVETGEFIPLVDGRTVPIKFRIEAGALGRGVALVDVVPLVGGFTSMSGQAPFAEVGGLPNVAFACRINGTETPCDQPLRWNNRGLVHGDRLTVEVAATDLDQSPALPGPTAHVEALIDDLAPTIESQQPMPGAIVGPNHALSFVLDDAAATVTCLLDGQPMPCQPGVQHPVTLFNGLHEFSVTAADAVGNQSSAVSAYAVDAVGPVWDPDGLFVPPSPVGPSSTPATAIRFRAMDATGAPVTYRCSLDGAPFGDCSPGSPAAGTFEWSGLAGGEHHLTIIAYDRFQNASLPLEVTFVVEPN